MAPNINAFTVTTADTELDSTDTAETASNSQNPSDVLKGMHPVSPTSKGVPTPLPGSGSGVVYTDGKGKYVFRDGTSSNYNLYEYENGSWQQVTSQKPTGIPVVSNVLSGIDAVGSFFNKLSQGSTWVRIGEVAGGLILLGIGAAAVLSSSKTAKNVASTASSAAMVIPK